MNTESPIVVTVGQGEEPANEVPRDLRRELIEAIMKCTPKQRAWLRKLPKHNFQLWGVAMSSLGLSHNTIYKWLRQDRIKAVRALQDEIATEDYDISFRRVLAEYSAIAFAREHDAYDATGKLLGPHELPDEVSAVVCERSYDANGLPKLKFHEKKFALEFLANFKGMGAAKRFELTGANGEPLPGVVPVIHIVERADTD
jgi:hypothetical protein